VLINSPNNPTGQVWGNEAYAAIRQAIDELGPKDRPDVVFDDPYAEIVYDGLTPPFPLSGDPTGPVYIFFFQDMGDPWRKGWVFGRSSRQSACRAGDGRRRFFDACTRLRECERLRSKDARTGRSGQRTP